VQALLAQKAEMLREYAGLALEQDQQQQQPGLYLTALPLLLQGYVPDLSGLPHLILQLARDVDWDSEKECFRTLAAAVAQFYALKPLLPAAAAEQQQQQQPAQPDGTQPASAAAAPPAGGGTGNGEPQAEPQPMNVDLSNGAAAETRSSDVAAAATATAVQQTPPPPQPDGGLLLQAGHRSQAQREWLLRHVVMPAVKYVYRPSRERARDGSVLLLTSMERLYRVFERCGW
jgi:DNA mismatch repair protein MLH1